MSDYGIFIDLFNDPVAAAKYKARLQGINDRYFEVMRRIGWRRLHGDKTGPWYRPR